MAAWSPRRARRSAGCCRRTSPSPTRRSSRSSGYLTPAYDPFAVSGDPEPGGLPGPEPDAARPLDAGTAAAPPRHGQVARRLRPRRPGDAADHQPRPVRRAGVLAADLERGPGRVPDAARSPTRSARSTAGRPSASRACWPAGWSRRASRSSRSTTAGPASSAGTRTPRTSRRSRTPWHRRSTRASPRCVEDLAERGLLDDTLVVMMGEFGRTPKINPNAGRDHHGRANSRPALRRGDSRGAGPGPDRRQRRHARRAPGHARRPGLGALPQAGNRPGDQVRSARRPARSGWSTAANPPRELI